MRPGLSPGAIAVGVVVGGVVAGGVALRFVTRSPLWLDEALSVNVADLALGDIGSALRHDGHPPLYYWLLHGWIEIFGRGDVAVRALSGLVAVATLPLAYLAGRRVGGRAGAIAAVVLLALSPYATRYATEARMYALVMLVVLAGYLAVRRMLERPTIHRAVVVGLLAGAVCWLHYWGIFLVVATAAVLALVAAREKVSTERRAPLAVIGALAAGGATLVFWLPSLLYQLRHTGTPWAERTRPTTSLAVTLDDLGGLLVDAHLLGVAIILLVALALFVAPGGDGSGDPRFVPRTTPGVRGELAVVALTLALGLGVAFVTGGGYQSRYAAVVVPLLLLTAAAGVARLPHPDERAVALSVAGALAAPGLVSNVITHRTQAGVVVEAVNAWARPGDVVVYCPDQLGPAFSRDLNAGLDRRVYPTGAAPGIVDWADYEDRNAAADPTAFAQTALAAAAGHDLFLVWSPGYRTFGQDCELLAAEFENARPGSAPIVVDDGEKYFEHAWLTLYAG